MQIILIFSILISSKSEHSIAIDIKLKKIEFILQFDLLTPNDLSECVIRIL